MHPQLTTIYLVGGDQALTIDSGEDLERYRWMLRGYLAALEHCEIAQSAVTHYHADHSANLRWLRDEFGATVHVLDAGRALLADRLPDAGVVPFDDGATIDAGGAKLTALHTPGHSTDSVCYFLADEGVLFTGDTVLGASSTTITDLADYMASLERLRALPNLRLLCPGHGPPIENPAAYIDDYIEPRERQILNLLEGGAVRTSWEIVEALYTDIDPRLRRAADRNVRTHLDKLAKEGRMIVYEGVRRERSPAEAATAAEEEHARLEVIRRADEYREQVRRRELFLQENPPSDEWLEPPHYQLA
jgi:glyoxylase-like metal-dependent hydrolase (beta-lactamase superfamily II)